MAKLSFGSENETVTENMCTEGTAGTCGVMLIHRPVVHLERGVATVSGEADHVVFAIIYGGSLFFDGDINCANIEDNSDFPLFL